jgi:hypothetical protein
MNSKYNEWPIYEKKKKKKKKKKKVRKTVYIRALFIPFSHHLLSLILFNNINKKMDSNESNRTLPTTNHTRYQSIGPIETEEEVKEIKKCKN